MVTRITRLITLFLIVALAAGVIVLNSGEITLRVLPGTSFTAMGGVIFLTVFGAGIGVAACFWVIFGIRSYFRERTLRQKEQNSHKFYQAMLEARSLAAAGEHSRAQDRWEKQIKRDPSDVIARIELSRTLQGEGRTEDALKVLDDARAKAPENIEVLFRAAELNIQLGNNTAAIDNLALVLYHEPNARAARLARDLSETLGRIEDAIEYNRQLANLGGLSTDDPSAIRLDLKRILSDGDSDREAELRKFVKRNPEFDPGLGELAQIELSKGDVEAAVELYLRAGKRSKVLRYWEEASRIWIEHGSGDRAVAAAKTAVRNTEGRENVLAHLHLARVYLQLSSYTEAKELLAEIPGKLEQEHLRSDGEIARAYLALKGYCLNQLKEYHDAAEVWRELSNSAAPEGTEKISSLSEKHGVLSLNGNARPLSLPLQAAGR